MIDNSQKPMKNRTSCLTSEDAVEMLLDMIKQCEKNLGFKVTFRIDSEGNWVEKDSSSANIAIGDKDSLIRAISKTIIINESKKNE